MKKEGDSLLDVVMTSNTVDRWKLALRTIKKIRKKLVDPDFNVVDMTVRKIQDRSGHRFISNVQQLVDNDPSISNQEIPQ